MKEHIENSDYRKFGFTMGIMILIIFGLFLPFVFRKAFPLWPWFVALIFFASAAILPGILVVIYRPWMYVGGIIGMVNSKILLGLVFFLMITPISLFLKLIGKDPMNRKIKRKNQPSYWKDSPKQKRVDMERPY